MTKEQDMINETIKYYYFNPENIRVFKCIEPLQLRVDIPTPKFNGLVNEGDIFITEFESYEDIKLDIIRLYRGANWIEVSGARLLKSFVEITDIEKEY